MARKETSAGLLMYSNREELRVFLAHLGGPYFAKKDNGSWTIPKGLVEPDEDPLGAACREFAEETGYQPDFGKARFISLGSVVQKNGKTVLAWAFEGVWPEGTVLRSNTFQLEWPPKSGRIQPFPEIDRAEMFSIGQARRKINQRQIPLIDRLVTALSYGE